MSEDKFRFYKEYPKTCAAEDFWGQVKRTVNGVPVTQEQIDMIVGAVVRELDLKKEDTLLDLCCGNGALSTLFFKHCRGGIGVDFSEYLISVANRYFRSSNQDYVLNDVVDFCRAPTCSSLFSKVVCYGSFPFIEQKRAAELLQLLNSNFPNVEKVFIGNCPDKNLLHLFYQDKAFIPGIENNPDSPIGIWRSQEEFISLAGVCGWQAAIHRMPKAYYAAHYRYDVILTR